MIDDIIADPRYWIVFSIFMGISYFALGFRLLDFKFFIALPVCQHIAHIFCLPSEYLSSLIFSVGTLVLIIVGRYVCLVRRKPRDFLVAGSFGVGEIDQRFEIRFYFAAGSLFLLSYFTLRFIFYPQFFSALDLEARLLAQLDDRLIFVLSLAAPAALGAVMVKWVTNNRLGLWDKFLAGLLFVGYLSSGSKQSIAPIFLTFIGVSTYMGRNRNVKKTVLALIAIAVVGTIALMFLFPDLSSGDLFNLVFYRVVASSEEMEYLYVLHFQPGQYPFAGIGALLAPAAKLLGQNIEYPAGVWLYGQRYNNWLGYGPNSGFVIEYFGNLGYVGLVIPLIIGASIGYCDSKKTSYRAVWLSILPFALTETLMFVVAAATHICLMCISRLVTTFLFPRIPINSVRASQG